MVSWFKSDSSMSFFACLTAAWHLWVRLLCGRKGSVAGVPSKSNLNPYQRSQSLCIGRSIKIINRIKTRLGFLTSVVTRIVHRRTVTMHHVGLRSGDGVVKRPHPSSSLPRHSAKYSLTDGPRSGLEPPPPHVPLRSYFEVSQHSGMAEVGNSRVGSDRPRVQ